MELNEDKLIIETGDTLECIKEVTNELENINKGDLFVVSRVFTKVENDKPIKYVTIQNKHRVYTCTTKKLSQFFTIQNEYIHLKTGNHYEYIKPIRVKHPDTGKWFDGVLYKSLKTKEEFVRSKESFESHFKKI